MDIEENNGRVNWVLIPAKSVIPQAASPNSREL